jgi:hypothetical protein
MVCSLGVALTLIRPLSLFRCPNEKPFGKSAAHSRFGSLRNISSWVWRRPRVESQHMSTTDKSEEVPATGSLPPGDPKSGTRSPMHSDLPKYQDLMYPVLQCVGRSGGSARGRELTAEVILAIAATDEQVAISYENRPKSVLVDRIDWARSYDKLAGALDNPQRGLYVLSEVGKELLELPEADAIARLRELDRQERAARPGKGRANAANTLAPVEDDVEEDAEWTGLTFQSRTTNAGEFDRMNRIRALKELCSIVGRRRQSAEKIQRTWRSIVSLVAVLAMSVVILSACGSSSTSSSSAASSASTTPEGVPVLLYCKNVISSLMFTIGTTFPDVLPYGGVYLRQQVDEATVTLPAVVQTAVQDAFANASHYGQDTSTWTSQERVNDGNAACGTISDLSSFDNELVNANDTLSQHIKLITEPGSPKPDTSPPSVTTTILPQLPTPTPSTTVPISSSTSPAFSEAQQDWEAAAPQCSACQGQYWIQAATALISGSQTASDLPGYLQAASELTNLASLPDAMDTPAQQEEIQNDITDLDAFFGTPGLYD